MASLSLAAAGLLAAPGTSFAAVSCSYSNADHLLTVVGTDAFAGITRAGDAIEVDDGSLPVSCAGGPPTVTKVDLVRVSHSGRTGDRIDLANGPLAPGASPEATGLPEIEFDYVDQTIIDIHGSSAADRLTLGPLGSINLNGDDDVDVTGRFTSIVLEGAGGDDLIAPQSDYTSSGAHLIMAAGGGNDRLTATREGDVMHGGEGRDLMTGGPRADNLTGGEGRDLIRAGKGGDIVRAIDGTRDRILCGPGFDKLKADTVDRYKGCERLIALKGPRR